MKRTQFSLASLNGLVLVAAVAVLISIFGDRKYLAPRWKELRARHAKTPAAERSELTQVNRKRKELVFRGIDLTTAPRHTDVSKLADLFEESPPGSKSYQLRETVVTWKSDIDGSVYWVPNRSQFYIQAGPIYSSTLVFYGPFDGDPKEHLRDPSQG